MSTGRAGGRRLASAVLAALVTSACGGADGAATSTTTIVASPETESSARPIDERDGARDAVRTTDLAVMTEASGTGLEITITNLGPNPAARVVVLVTMERGSLLADDDRCAASPDGFRCALGEILAREAASISFGGASAAGTVAVEHDGPELRPDDNTVSF